tara:strand:+ start:162 stop:1007 length:846 start_codon:yes stop_codon:yes gene_type:complete
MVKKIFSILIVIYVFGRIIIWGASSVDEQAAVDEQTSVDAQIATDEQPAALAAPKKVDAVALLTAPRISSAIANSVQEDIATRANALATRISKIKGLPKAVSFSPASIINLALVCDENTRSDFVGNYFIFILEKGQNLTIPYHRIENRQNFVHSISQAKYSGALEFYYRDIYKNLSGWGDNYHNVFTSESSYVLSSSKPIPHRQKSSINKITIDRKTGVAVKSGTDSLGTYNYEYDCKKMSNDWAVFVLNFYEAIIYEGAAEEWLEAEAMFSSKRNTRSKF